MDRYMVTHSLLSSWLYAIKENPYEDATSTSDKMAEFMTTLRREPTETNEAMQKGIDFENLVTAILEDVDNQSHAQHQWYESARKAADKIKGGILQCKVKREVLLRDIPVLLYGRLDAVKAGVVYDIKFSGKYESGKYLDSTQHPMYFSLMPEAWAFCYLVSNGSELWMETYRRDETADIQEIIAQFFGWLETQGLTDVYREHWKAL